MSQSTVEVKEFSIFVEDAKWVLESLGLSGHPHAVELMAIRIQALIERDRTKISSEIAGLASTMHTITRLQLEGIGFDILHAERDEDGDFVWSIIPEHG